MLSEQEREERLRWYSYKTGEHLDEKLLHVKQRLKEHADPNDPSYQHFLDELGLVEEARISCRAQCCRAYLKEKFQPDPATAKSAGNDVPEVRIAIDTFIKQAGGTKWAEEQWMRRFGQHLMEWIRMVQECMKTQVKPVAETPNLVSAIPALASVTLRYQRYLEHCQKIIPQIYATWANIILYNTLRLPHKDFQALLTIDPLRIEHSGFWVHAAEFPADSVSFSSHFIYVPPYVGEPIAAFMRYTRQLVQCVTVVTS